MKRLVLLTCATLLVLASGMCDAQMRPPGPNQPDVTLSAKDKSEAIAP